MMTFPIYGKMKNVPNHQPGIHIHGHNQVQNNIFRICPDPISFVTLKYSILVSSSRLIA